MASDGQDRGLLSERIRVSLTDDISSGVITPGTVLDETTIAESFGASRTPVREAIRQLEAAGLIEIRPRRGIIVLPLTLLRLHEMFEVTAELEALCVRLATHRMTGGERAELIGLHMASEAFVANNDLPAYDAQNIKIHESIYKSTHNDFLLEHAINLRSRLIPFRRTQLRSANRLDLSFKEHGRIINAIVRGRADEAASLMREHMRNAATALSSYYESKINKPN